MQVSGGVEGELVDTGSCGGQLIHGTDSWMHWSMQEPASRVDIILDSPVVEGETTQATVEIDLGEDSTWLAPSSVAEIEEVYEEEGIDAVRVKGSGSCDTDALGPGESISIDGFEFISLTHVHT